MTEVADLLLMQQRLRQCTSMTELGHLVTNDSTRIFKYVTALLWRDATPKPKLTAVSGIPEPVPNTPFHDWTGDVIAQLSNSGTTETSRVRSDLLNPETSARWPEYLPPDAIYIPLTGEVRGGLLLARSGQWTDEECHLADYWGGAVSHAIAALENRSQGRLRRSLLERRNVIGFLLVLVVLSVIVPVRQSVNAEAEIVPRDPEIIRSSLEGVIGEIVVEPNEPVDEGDLLLTFDDRSIQTQLEVVRQELEIARAEYRRADQASVSDRRAAQQLPVLASRIEQREAELDYVQSQLARARVHAETSGIAIVSSPGEMEGRPVRIGEKLMMIASPDNVEIEFWVSVGDSIALEEGADVTLFPNVQPDNAYSATLRYISYQAEVSPQGVFGFRGRATLDPQEATPRIGWRGTARLYGDRVPLIYYLLRRPIAVLREWTGL